MGRKGLGGHLVLVGVSSCLLLFGQIIYKQRRRASPLTFTIGKMNIQKSYTQFPCKISLKQDWLLLSKLILMFYIRQSLGAGSWAARRVTAGSWQNQWDSICPDAQLLPLLTWGRRTAEPASLVAGLQQSEYFSALFPWTPLSQPCVGHMNACVLFMPSHQDCPGFWGGWKNGNHQNNIMPEVLLVHTWAFWDRMVASFVSSWYDPTSAVIASRKTITGPLSHSDYKSHISLLLYICIYMYICIQGFMCTSLGIIHSMCVYMYKMQASVQIK